MLTAMNRIPVKAEHAEAFEANFINRASALKGQKGFVTFRLLRPGNPEDPYIVMTIWETQDDFHEWTQSEAFRQSHANADLRDALSGRPKLEIHEVVQEIWGENL